MDIRQIVEDTLVAPMRERAVEIICGSLDGDTDEAMEGKIYLDIILNGDHINGWVKPSTSALIKGLSGKGSLANTNVVGELAELGAILQASGKAIRAATFELNARQRLIEDYRRDVAAHERMVGKLLKLLDNDDLDGARDIVKAEYEAIHGPRD